MGISNSCCHHDTKCKILLYLENQVLYLGVECILPNLHTILRTYICLCFVQSIEKEIDKSHLDCRHFFQVAQLMVHEFFSLKPEINPKPGPNGQGIRRYYTSLGEYWSSPKTWNISQFWHSYILVSPDLG